MSTLSAHVLDSTYGVPAAGMRLSLATAAGEQRATATTDADGRVRFDLELEQGDHRLLLESGAWFTERDRDHFHPEIAVAFSVDPAQEHYHLAVLLSPYSYTTYRGS